ncbi:MAG: MBL fold metallo-hydrolase [Bosea sp.]|uniref:MBL fold metallo-hydrolase n=1 Tax=Bosea sp. (in: a-proteobacteria) TaxID=1871050 RepID=UPI002399EC5D|nr:MBL fold metallo-hydrolase [Bosea sp. (in: a-proteobacteria)]MCP4735225.1 MBL fold metallo-hydrolase [Bosea sp. (in: a-proteobacteria)]
MSVEVETFYDERSGTATHIAFCRASFSCAVIDPVFDLDPKSGRTTRAPVDALVGFIREHDLKLEWILETHVHHDHVSGAFALREELGGRIAIGRKVGEVADVVRNVYALNASATPPFDRLLDDGDRLKLGEETIEVLATPGHTIDHLSYRIGDAIFLGDTLFMPDSGTARCDFHRADAHRLYASIRRILAEPDDVRLFVCHDYGAGGIREPAWETTVGAQRAGNIHVGRERGEDDFVSLRRNRDAGLDMPALLLACLPLNIEAGRFPAPAVNGRVILSIPLDVPGDAI